MDCTELIKNLREDDFDDLYFSEMLMNKAADAIEELQARIQKMDMEIEALLLLVTRKDNTKNENEQLLNCIRRLAEIIGGMTK